MVFSARFRALPRSSHDAREAVLTFARSCGFPEAELRDVEIAAGEAIANAIEHGNRFRGSIAVAASFSNDSLTIEVRDSGRGFEEPQVATASSYRGWGISIMRKLVDRVTFLDGGTLVRLEKHLAQTSTVSRAAEKLTGTE